MPKDAWHGELKCLPLIDVCADEPWYWASASKQEADFAVEQLSVGGLSVLKY